MTEVKFRICSITHPPAHARDWNRRWVIRIRSHAGYWDTVNFLRKWAATCCKDFLYFSKDVDFGYHDGGCSFDVRIYELDDFLLFKLTYQ